VPVDVQATGPVWAPARHAQVVIEATREALNNVEKASRATRALIRAEVSDGWIVVSVRDNGRGFIYEEGVGGYGIANSMKRPVEAIGGTFRLVSAPDLGCDVEFRVPAEANGGSGGPID
jgi:signal transduction histidine kinase